MLGCTAFTYLKPKKKQTFYLLSHTYSLNHLFPSRISCNTDFQRQLVFLFQAKWAQSPWKILPYFLYWCTLTHKANWESLCLASSAKQLRSSALKILMNNPWSLQRVTCDKPCWGNEFLHC